MFYIFLSILRFLPPPIPLEMDNNGLALKEGRFGNLFQGLYLQKIKSLECYDEYCLSVHIKGKKGKTKLQKRTCKHCGLYHSTIAAKKSHQRTCSGTIYESENDDPEEDEWDYEEDIITVSDDERQDEPALENEHQNAGDIFERIDEFFGIN